MFIIVCFLCAAVTIQDMSPWPWDGNQWESNPFAICTTYSVLCNVPSETKQIVWHWAYTSNTCYGCVVCEVWLRLKNTLSSQRTIQHNTSRRQKSKTQNSSVALKIRSQLITETVEQHINIKAACHMMDVQPVQKIQTLRNRTPHFIMCNFHIKNKLFLTNYILCWTKFITTISLVIKHLTLNLLAPELFF